MSNLTFDGDVVVVTGAGGGMGRTHALELAWRGARVVVNDLGGHPFGGGSDPGMAEAVVEEIRAFGGEAVASTQSVATPEGGASIIETAVSRWGRLDAVVSNAAILRNLPIEEMTPQDFDDVLDVNLRGAWFVIQPAYKALKAGGGGRVLAVTSTAGLLGSAGQANYSAAKAGLIGLVRTIAAEGQAHGIKANLLAPGALGTRMSDAMTQAQQQAAGDDAATADRANVLANPEVAQRMSSALVSPMVSVLVHPSCPVNGQILTASGGLFGRAATTLNRGWLSKGTPAAEDLLAHWNEITSRATAEEPEGDAFADANRTFELIFGS